MKDETQLHIWNCSMGPLLQVSSGDVTVDPELRGGCGGMVFPKDVDSFGGKQQNQV